VCEVGGGRLDRGLDFRCGVWGVGAW
jgi:hypothetical protein